MDITAHPLLIAISKGNNEDASAMINSPEFNPNVELKKNSYWNTEFPLILAAEVGNTEIVQLLIEKGADIKTQGEEALFKAIKDALLHPYTGGHVDIVRLLLSFSDIDIEAEASEEDLWRGAPEDYRPTLLNYAVHLRANLDIIKLLLAYGADVNKKDWEGRTTLMSILHTAPHRSQEYVNELVDILLQNPTIDLNQTDLDRNTILTILENSRRWAYSDSALGSNEFYNNLKMKLIAHGAQHPNIRKQRNEIYGDDCYTCIIFGPGKHCPCNTNPHALSFLKNRRNATWKRRRAALMAYHRAHANEFEARAPAAAAANNGNGGNAATHRAGNAAPPRSNRKTMRRHRR